MQLVEIFGTAVVGVDDVRLRVSRGRVAVEARRDAGTLADVVAIHRLRRGPVHVEACGRDDVHADFGWVIHPDSILDDRGVEPGLAKLAGYVIGGLAVLKRAGRVRLRGKELHFVFGAMRIGHRQKKFFPDQLGGSILKSRQRRRRSGVPRSRAVCEEKNDNREPRASRRHPGPTLGPKRRGNGTRDFDAGMWRRTRVSYSFEVADL